MIIIIIDIIFIFEVAFRISVIKFSMIWYLWYLPLIDTFSIGTILRDFIISVHVFHYRRPCPYGGWTNSAALRRAAVHRLQWILHNDDPHGRTYLFMPRSQRTLNFTMSCDMTKFDFLNTSLWIIGVSRRWNRGTRNASIRWMNSLLFNPGNLQLRKRQLIDTQVQKKSSRSILEWIIHSNLSNTFGLTKKTLLGVRCHKWQRVQIWTGSD